MSVESFKGKLLEEVLAYFTSFILVGALLGTLITKT